MSSGEDSAQLVAAFQKKGSRKAAPPPSPERVVSPIGRTASEHTLETDDAKSQSSSRPAVRQAVCVRVKPVSNRKEYVYYEPAEEVLEILKEYSKRGDMLYEARLIGHATKQVSVISESSPTECCERGKGTVTAMPTLQVVYLYNQLPTVFRFCTLRHSSLSSLTH
jgi:hypothetical protein